MPVSVATLAGRFTGRRRGRRGSKDVWDAYQKNELKKKRKKQNKTCACYLVTSLSISCFLGCRTIRSCIAFDVLLLWLFALSRQFFLVYCEMNTVMISSLFAYPRFPRPTESPFDIRSVDDEVSHSAVAIKRVRVRS